MKTVLIIGVGQIGKAITKRIIDMKPERIILHNLTKKESDDEIVKFKKLAEGIELVPSYGNVFMPYKYNTLSQEQEILEKKDYLLNFYYSNPTEEILKESTIYKLIEKWKPEIVVDSINTGTVLGSTYKPEQLLETVNDNSSEKEKTLTKVLLNDFVPKIINFVNSLKIAMEDFKVKKYIKVSTTGLGGMGINMPYTHGDTPKSTLSYALMGKISSAGVFHQLLWNLSHVAHLNISLVIPATFVGYDNAKFEPIETDIGLIKKVELVDKVMLEIGEDLKYNGNKTDEYLKFPVVRAGENHVYSLFEMSALTTIGQMEAVTKEEVADAVISDIEGKAYKNILAYLDSGMISPTYAGRTMRDKVISEIKSLMKENKTTSIATGNLGVTMAKQLYELFLIKSVCPTFTEITNSESETIYNKIIEYLNDNSDIIQEVLSLGIPILLENNEAYVGEYSLYPNKEEKTKITNESIENWAKTGWIDLRIKNINIWKKDILEIQKDAEELKKKDECFTLSRNPFVIEDNFDIGELMGYYYNLKGRGRRLLNK
ncbi:MAG: hypothetical protein IJN50_01005 [Clostridia bacterium]|nr:hypothetical protein [Clostridia bacterium]